MKRYLLMTTLAAALTATASGSFPGTYLMTSVDDYGMSTKSEVTVEESSTPGIVEVTGLIDADAFAGSVFIAGVDEEEGTLTFPEGQNVLWWESDVVLTRLEEGEEDYVAVDGPIVARRGDDGKITFDGIWGFLYDEEITYVVTEAQMVRPNAEFSFMYMIYTGDITDDTVALGVEYADNVLMVNDFSPISVDPIKAMKFNVDPSAHMASLADPEIPNATGWSGEERYLCTITKFNNDFFNPEIEFEKGLVCTVKDGNTLVFPDLWGIVTINPNEPNVAPSITGMYKAGDLACSFQLYDTTGVSTATGDLGNDSPETYYDLTGGRIESPKGFCIIVKDGKARKVLVRR